MEVLEREIWRIAVENLDYPEQHAWAALAGSRVNTQGWRRARAMLQNDQTKELRRRFLLTCVQRNRNAQLRLKALGEIADLGDGDAFDDAIDIVGTWSREDKRAGTKTMLQALIDKRIGRRDQAQAWVWRLAEYTRELHEEYAVQRWPETKRLLGLLVNSSGRAHGRNARRLVHAARKQDRRLAVALLASTVSHTPEGEEVLRGAKMRMARKPSAVARELLRNFPKGGKRRRKRGKRGDENGDNGGGSEAGRNGNDPELESQSFNGDQPAQKKRRRRKSKGAKGGGDAARNGGDGARDGDDRARDGGDMDAVQNAGDEPKADEKPKRSRRKPAKDVKVDGDAEADGGEAEKPAKAKPKRKRKPKAKAASGDSEAGQVDVAGAEGDAVTVGESDQ